MWNKIYLEGHRPSVPENMIFFADAISNVVATFDDYHFHDQWKQHCAGIESGVLNITNRTLPSLEQSMLKVGAFDSPRPEENRYIPEKLQEWDTVQRSIEDAAHDIGMAAYDGSLVKGFYRAKTGGKMEEMPSKFWGVDRDIFWERAHQCAFSPIDPFNLTAEPTHWIYLDQASFFQFCDHHREYWSLPAVHSNHYQSSTVGDVAQIKNARRGRKPNPEWVYVATALAEWMHTRNDEASGIAAIGPDVMLREVLALASERCPGELSRSTYQPAFQAVVKRFSEIAESE